MSHICSCYVKTCCLCINRIKLTWAQGRGVSNWLTGSSREELNAGVVLVGAVWKWVASGMPAKLTSCYSKSLSSRVFTLVFESPLFGGTEVVPPPQATALTAGR